MNYIQQTRADATVKDSNNPVKSPLDIGDNIDFTDIEGASTLSIRAFCKIYAALIDSSDLQDSLLHVPFLSLLENVTSALIPNLGCYWDSFRPSTMPQERLRIRLITIEFFIKLWNLPQIGKLVQKELLLGTIQKLMLHSPEKAIFRSLVASSCAKLLLSFPQYLSPAILLLISLGHNHSVFIRTAVIFTLSELFQSIELPLASLSKGTQLFDTRQNPAKLLASSKLFDNTAVPLKSETTTEIDTDFEESNQGSYLLPIKLPSKFKNLDTMEDSRPNDMISIPKAILYFILQRMSDKSFYVRSTAISQFAVLFKSSSESLDSLWTEILLSKNQESDTDQSQFQIQENNQTNDSNVHVTPMKTPVKVKQVKFAEVVTHPDKSQVPLNLNNSMNVPDIQQWDFFALLSARIRDSKPTVRRTAITFLISLLNTTISLSRAKNSKSFSPVTLTSPHSPLSKSRGSSTVSAVVGPNLIIPTDIILSLLPVVYDSCSDTSPSVRNVGISCFNLILQITPSQLVYSSWAFAIFPAAFTPDVKISALAFDSIIELVLQPIYHMFSELFINVPIYSPDDRTKTQSLDNCPPWKYLVIADSATFSYLIRLLSLLAAKKTSLFIAQEDSEGYPEDVPVGAFSINSFIAVLQRVCFDLPLQYMEAWPMLESLTHISECTALLDTTFFSRLEDPDSPLYLPKIIHNTFIFPLLSTIVSRYYTLIEALSAKPSVLKDSDLLSDSSETAAHSNNVVLSSYSRKMVKAQSSSMISMVSSLSFLLNSLFLEMKMPLTSIPFLILFSNQLSRHKTGTRNDNPSTPQLDLASTSTLDVSNSTMLCSLTEPGPESNSSCEIRKYLAFGFGLLFNSELNESLHNFPRVYKAMKPIEKMLIHPELKIQIIGYSIIGVACLGSSLVASRYIPLLVRALDLPYSHTTLKSTILIILCELFLRHTNIVVPFLPVLIKQLEDPDPSIRRQFIILLSRLVQESFIKKNKPIIYFPLLAKLVDSDVQVQLYARYCIFQILGREESFLSNLFPTIFFQFNRCETTKELSISKTHYDPTEGFTLSHLSKKHRLSIYFSILDHLTDPHKFNVQSRIVKTVLGGIVEEPTLLDDSSGISLLRDVLTVLSSSALTIQIHKQSLDSMNDDHIESGEPGEGSDGIEKVNQLKHARKMSKLFAVNSLLSKDICDNILPLVISLRKILVIRRSPLLRNLIAFVSRLKEEFPDTLNNALLVHSGFGDELGKMTL